MCAPIPGSGIDLFSKVAGKRAAATAVGGLTGYLLSKKNKPAPVTSGTTGMGMGTA